MLDTLAHSYIFSTSTEAVAVVALAEERKRGKYTGLDQNHSFASVVVETSAMFGPQSLALMECPVSP